MHEIFFLKLYLRPRVLPPFLVSSFHLVIPIFPTIYPFGLKNRKIDKTYGPATVLSPILGCAKTRLMAPSARGGEITQPRVHTLALSKIGEKSCVWRNF